MARMTAQDMVTEARLHLGGETTETLTDNQILRWLNRAYVELASAYKFSELETSVSITTASGTAEYEVSAADVLEVLSVIDDTNNALLYPWSRWQYDAATQGGSSSVTGVPSFWFISGVGANSRRQFTFYPTPAGTYTINVIYRKKPTELVLSPAPTSCVLLEPFDEPLILRAVSKGWRALGDDTKSAAALAASKESERYALKSCFTASYEPFQPGSVVAGALR